MMRIKSKSCIAICIIYLYVCLLGGYAIKAHTNMQTAKIFVYGGMNVRPCILEINDGCLKVTVGNNAEDLFYGRDGRARNRESFDKRYVREKSIKLSMSQQEEIDKLIENAKANSADSDEFSLGASSDITLIQANIGKRDYISRFEPVNENVNALQKLTYKLIDISPLKIGGVTEQVKLLQMGGHFYWEYPYLYVRLADKRIFQLNSVAILFLSLLVGILLITIFNTISKHTQKKWITFIPYILCFVGLLLGYILGSMSDVINRELREYFVYMLMCFIFTIIWMILLGIIKKTRICKRERA